MKRFHIHHRFLLSLTLAALVVAGCDSTPDPGDVQTRVRGVVTDDAGFGKAQDEIEDAEITAYEVEDDGSTQPTEERTTTDEQGRYTLELRQETDVVVVVAQKGSFQTKTLVYTAGEASVNAMPMTTETEAEADVYVEAREDDSEGSVTVADVALYVTQETAAEVEAGSTTAAQVAATIIAGERAERSYERPADEEEKFEEKQRNERQAFLRLQAELSASSSTSAQTAAINSFQEALVEAYADAGISAQTQAKARQASRAAIVKFSSGLSSNARFAIRKQAEIVTALATAQAVEATFRAHGGSEARVNTLANARADLVAKLRAASSMNAIAEAEAEYEATVEETLAAEIEVNASTLATATTAVEAAKAVLSVSLNLAGSGEAVAEAYADFFTTAEAGVKQALTTNAKAELAAETLVLLTR